MGFGCLNGILIMCKWLPYILDVALCHFCLAWVEQWGRTNILAQASSSRLGENTSSSLRVLPRALAQARGCVLSDRPARSGETASPKRGIVKLSKTHCCRLA